MDIIKIAHITNVALIYFMAIGLGFFLTWKLKLGWRLFFIGSATYFAVWLLLMVVVGLVQSIIPSAKFSILEQLLISIILLLILTAIEELIRYAMYRFWATDVRAWPQGLLVGAGHGGLEVMLTGFSALLYLSQMLSLRYADLSTKFSADVLPQVTKDVTNYWSAAWYNAIIEAVHSGLTLPIQLACSLLILQVFLRGQYRWLGISIGWHAMASLPYLFIPSQYTYLPLLLIGGISVSSIFLILRLQPKQEQAIEIAQ